MNRPRKAAAITLVLVVCLPGSRSLAQQRETELQRLSQEGERALAENRYADAERAYEKLRQLSPGTAEVHATLGLIYFQEGKFSQAVPTLRQGLKLKPTLPNADVLLAMSLSELGHFQEALPGLEKGFQKSPDAAMKRMAGLQLQRAYTGLQRHSQAVEVALDLTRSYPKDPEILYHASRLLANFAYLTIQHLAKVAPDSLWMHLAAGEAYESQGQLERALNEYREVLALDPGRPGIHFRLGRVLLARSDQPGSNTTEAEALKEFEQELRVDPSNANAAYEMGELHRKSGKFDKARELFEIAVKYYPDFEEALVGLGRTLVAAGQPAAALPPLRKAISLNPGDDVAYFQLSRAFQALGNEPDQQKALAEYQRLHEQRRGREAESPTSIRSDVTKQELDPKPPK